MTSVEALLTAEEFFALPEPAEGGKMELVDGKVVCMPPVGEDHGRRAGRLFRSLDEFVERYELGVVGVEVGFLLRKAPDLLRAPDISFISNEALDPKRDTSKYLEGPPTLAIEIVSPNDQELEISQKVGEYLTAGAHRVWVVRPRLQTITVHRPGGDSHTYSIEDTLTSDDAGFAVEGFELPLREAFR